MLPACEPELRGEYRLLDLRNAPFDSLQDAWEMPDLRHGSRSSPESEAKVRSRAGSNSRGRQANSNPANSPSQSDVSSSSAWPTPPCIAGPCELTSAL